MCNAHVLVYVCVHLFIITYSNQSFYRQIVGYRMTVTVEYPSDERERERGITDKQISYMTLIGMYSTMHLIHPYTYTIATLIGIPACLLQILGGPPPGVHVPSQVLQFSILIYDNTKSYIILN